MKKMGRLKLIQLGKAELEAWQTRKIIGGGDPGTCCCGCSGSGNTGSVGKSVES